MGTCIVCGELVSVEMGDAWKITEGLHEMLAAQRMYWIHRDCIELARSEATTSV